MSDKTPWAILLCKWKSTSAEPRSISFFRQLFTSDGAGTSNMVDFFDQMSHGTIDVGASKVFGWYRLNKAQADYAGNASPVLIGQIDRQGLVDLAKATASADGVDLSAFHGVVVCMNTLTDLFGGDGPQALCDPNSFKPSALGQEMGHGYGLAHSRRDGSTRDYQDRWDAMSTFSNAYIEPESNLRIDRPGLECSEHARARLARRNASLVRAGEEPYGRRGTQARTPS